ncbi:MAG: hypothetical protein NWQ13_01380, partial [Glaciimonas sp.]|nr:hypothetical protein [Glaciimonas sp.]
MKKLTVLLPLSLPSPELARDLLRDLSLPMLATLASRAKSGQQSSQLSALFDTTFDEYARALPHEMWLAQQFGIDATVASASNSTTNSSPAIAHTAMRSFDLPTDSGHWFVLHPAHIHIARDHLVLTDIRQVQLSDADARSLFDTAKTLFDEGGKTLLYGDAQTWFMRADDWSDLQTSTPDAACG